MSFANQILSPKKTTSSSGIHNRDKWETYIDFYADDATVHYANKNKNVVQMKLQNGTDGFLSWCLSNNKLRGTRNLSFVLRRSLLRTFETIWIFVITFECSNITASKSSRRERKMRPMELSGVNFSTHGSESEC